MKYRLLEILRCPECYKPLNLEVFREESREHELAIEKRLCNYECGRHKLNLEKIDQLQCKACYVIEVLEGKLSCSCGRSYPVINGISRLLSKQFLQKSLIYYHRDFFSRFPKQFASLVTDDVEFEEREKNAILHSFSYQWTTFTNNFDYYRDIFLSFIHPFLGPDDFRNQLVLEVGCGSGRPESVACSFGAEVVAIDLSEAVETAHNMSRYYPALHVIQGDAYSLPVCDCFDFVYSVGVLQHIPDLQRALRGIARVVPRNHPLVLWVYGIREFWYQPIEILRKITIRLPFKILHLFSVLLAILSELLLLFPYRILSRFIVTKKIAEKIPGRIYARFPFRKMW